MNLRELQLKLPWSIRYSADFRANPQPHKDFAHALTHIHKAAGQLSALVDDMDHRKETADNSAHIAEYDKYIADLVICAMRMANTRPGGVLDLEQAVVDRIESKNGVKLFGIDMASKKDITTFHGITIKAEDYLPPDYAFFVNGSKVYNFGGFPTKGISAVIDKYNELLLSGKLGVNEVRYRMPVEVAFARGKAIQMYHDPTDAWIDVHHPSFNWSVWDYRVKPE